MTHDFRSNSLRWDHGVRGCNRLSLAVGPGKARGDEGRAGGGTSARGRLRDGQDADQDPRGASGVGVRSAGVRHEKG